VIKRTVRIRPLRDPAAASDDASYWRRQPAAARLAAVEFLRRQVYGAPARLLRVARVVQRPGFVGASVHGSGILNEFVNAFYGLTPWDDWHDPYYLDHLLVSPEKKPVQRLVYKSK
jgi:hypothetical protein